MRSLIATILLLGSLAAWATPSQKEVEAAVARGDYSQAETMMKDVVADKPNSAKAHYVYAEILAHEGRFADATDQALQAKKLDPAIHFTSPDKFRAFEAKLLASANGRTAPAPQVHTSSNYGSHGNGYSNSAPPPRQESSSGFLWIVLAVLVIGGLWFLFGRRSSGVVMQQGGVGYGGAPGFGGSGPTVINNGGGGMGGVGSGLAGFAAGVAATELYEHLAHPRNDTTYVERDRSQGYDNSSYDADRALQNDPVDFGNSSSWDDSSSSSWDSGSSDSGSSDSSSDW